MGDATLFPLDEVPEVPLLREPRRRGPAEGVSRDARFLNDYPPDWHRCQKCRGVRPHDFQRQPGTGMNFCAVPGCTRTIAAHEGWSESCPDCLGTGSVKARARFEAGYRCERCLHPYVPKGDARMLDVAPSWREGGWSPCDERCAHAGPGRIRRPGGEWVYIDGPPSCARTDYETVETRWRVLTVHHLDGDKANVRWWNLAALCQRCHLEIQAKVVMERVYPHEHSSWFKPHVAGYYAWVYEQREVTREEAAARLDELLALELTPA